MCTTSSISSSASSREPCVRCSCCSNDSTGCSGGFALAATLPRRGRGRGWQVARCLRRPPARPRSGPRERALHVKMPRPSGILVLVLGVRGGCGTRGARWRRSQGGRHRRSQKTRESSPASVSRSGSRSAALGKAGAVLRVMEQERRAGMRWFETPACREKHAVVISPPPPETRCQPARGAGINQCLRYREK